MSLPDIIREERVIPVVRGLDESSVAGVVTALRAGGIHSIEITVEGESGFDAIRAVAGTEVLVGAGTVTSPGQAAEALAAGAQFIVAPHFDARVMEWAARSRVPFIPGALTPTEVFTAWSSGAAAVKVFPAHVSGPDYIRSLLGPYPDLTLVPTGGITADNAADYLAAGAAAVGVGGWLTGGEDLDEIARRAKVLIERIG